MHLPERWPFQKQCKLLGFSKVADWLWSVDKFRFKLFPSLTYNAKQEDTICLALLCTKGTVRHDFSQTLENF